MDSKCFSYKNKLIIIAALFIAVVLAGIFIFRFSSWRSVAPESSVSPEEINTENNETGGYQPANYPPNLLEGNIISLDAGDTITILAEFSKIAPELGAIEKPIDISGAEVVVYNLDTKKESLADIDSLKIGDSILVFTKELNYDGSATLEKYTAMKITKMVKNEDGQ